MLEAPVVFMFLLEAEVKTIERTAVTIFVVFQNTGGFLSLLFAVSKVIFNPIQQFLYYSSISSKVLTS